MPSPRIDNDRWAHHWGVPAALAQAVRDQMHRELYHVFNSPRTTPDTGRILLFPDHLQRPGQTGMYLLEKMKVDLTPLPKDLQFLISSTSCQHRIEFLGAVPTVKQGEGLIIPRLVYYDGRAMYLGCCQGLGIAGGRYTHTEGEDIREDERGRARVAFSAPWGWDHVGLLPVKGLSGWEWPTGPATHQRETWADLCEIRFARSQGWAVEVLEKTTWPEARPLDLWAQRLSRLYLKARQEGQDDLAGCYRAIALHTIGRLHNLGYRDSREVVEAGDERATFEATERVGPEGVTIKTRVAVDKPQQECHPEWSAAVWSKVHLRVAKALMATDRANILAVRGDAIYLLHQPHDPEWVDDGKVGKIRLKGIWNGPLPAPRHWADLKKITDAPQS
jgi:hypothetical protein